MNWFLRLFLLDVIVSPTENDYGIPGLALVALALVLVIVAVALYFVLRRPREK